MREFFTNAPLEYDYHAVRTLEVRRTKSGEEVRRMEVAIECEDLYEQLQRPRYLSGLYWADDTAPLAWDEMEVVR